MAIFHKLDTVKFGRCGLKSLPILDFKAKEGKTAYGIPPFQQNLYINITRKKLNFSF